MPIEFDRDVQSASYDNPFEDFEETTVETEVRRDPLTGQQSRIVSRAFVPPSDEPDIEAAVSDPEACFFCPDLIDDFTPTYPDWVGQDRGSHGEATSFPNLYPYASHSNVVALTQNHFVPLDELGAERIEHGVTAAVEFVETVFDHDTSARFGSVNMNFLPSAGASMVHPHLQTLVDDRGTDAQARRIRAAREYYDATDTTYWADLVAAERGGERWIGATGPVDWLAAFAPTHHRHVLGVLDRNRLDSEDEDGIAGLATGLEHVLEYYGESGLNAFNFALHLVDDYAVPPVIDVCNRAVFGSHYWSDATFFTTLHDEAVVDVAPETYAAELREWF